MRRLFGVLAGIVLLTALPAMAMQEKEKEKKADKAEKSEGITATGKVSAVSADSLTVKGKSAEWTFTVDSKTVVTAAGASHKTAAMKAEDKPPMITDFVKVGDSVSVRYHDMDGTKHASTVRVTKSKM